MRALASKVPASVRPAGPPPNAIAPHQQPIGPANAPPEFDPEANVSSVLVPHDEPSAIPLCLSSRIRRGEKIQETLLGRKVVLWRGKDDALGILPDACRHQGAALSRGSVGKSGIVCRYHGRAYDLLGRCTLSNGERGPFANKHFHAAEHDGVVWIAGQALNLEGKLAIPFQDDVDLSGYRTLRGQRDMRGSTFTLHDNTVDVKHLPTVHGGRMFVSELPMPTLVDAFTQEFNYGMAMVNPFTAFFGAKSSRVTVRDFPPYSARISIMKPDADVGVHLHLDAVPILEPGPGLGEPKTRLVWRVSRNLLTSPVFDPLLRWAIRWTVGEDGDVVEGVEAARDRIAPHDTSLLERLKTAPRPERRRGVER